MIEKMTHTIILMLTIDLESARECQKLSEKVYNENRCFEAYNIYSTVPPRKPVRYHFDPYCLAFPMGSGADESTPKTVIKRRSRSFAAVV